MAAFRTDGLTKRYASTEALRGVDIEIAPGSIVGLIGPNGAGKSTLMKIGCGLVRPTAGTATVCGSPAGSRESRAALGYLAELFRFPGWATADEVLAMHQRLAPSSGGPAERGDLLDRVGLSEARSTRVDQMSKGMQQRLGIAQALVGGPRLLLLDEPASALDPAGRRLIRDLLLDLRAAGTAVLMNSHLLSEVEEVCDQVTILVDGAAVAAGPPDEVVRPGGLEIETGAGLKRYPAATRDEVPGLVAGLVQAGEQVYGVRLVTGTLEDAYLDLVGRDPG